MSFKAQLSLEGNLYDIITCEYKLIQEVNAAGKPISGVKTGLITLTMTGTDDELLASWAVDSQKTLDGIITFFRPDQESKFKELSFEGAYCVSYHEVFLPLGNPIRGHYPVPLHLSSAYYFEISISPGKISLGGVSHDNQWPGIG